MLKLSCEMHKRSYFLVLFLAISYCGTSSQVYSNPLDRSTETANTRRFFLPEDSRDLANVVADRERNVVYVGAVNYLYALDADDITIKRGEVHWAPNDFQVTLCQNFKGDAVRCQNTIKVLHSANETHIFACGTMAFSPLCIYVNKQDFKRAPGPGERGKWRSPEDPLSSVVSTMAGNALFSASTPVTANKNGAICKTNGGENSLVKTNENDDFWLSDPRFVSAFTVRDADDQEKVMFLLKENAEEIPMEILTQDNDRSASVMYSRLVSICANDLGGNPWILKHKFATFTKMRIACPVEINRGKSRRTIPFFYDEIQSSFVVENPNQPDNPTIYAIFTTPSGAFEATATCVFEMNDIRKYLASNKYWNKPWTSQHLFQTYDDTENPAPGTCVQDTTALSATRLTFGNEHPIKYGIIKPKIGHAIYQDPGIIFSHIIVDRIKRREKRQIGLVEKEYDVVHYITETGFIKRIVFSVENCEEYWEIPSRNIFHQNETVSSILTVKIFNGFLYFGTTSSLIQLKLAACGKYETCAKCSLSNDPYCDWNEIDNICEEVPFDVPTKRPPLPFKYFNETYCDQNDVNADKKSDAGELQEVDVETLLALNSDLLDINERQNASIANLKSQNEFLTMKLTESMTELSDLMTNYTHLSALLLQYDARRRMVIQLYKNTIFSLHSCQHDRTQRKTAERKAASEVANKRLAQSVFNVTNCDRLIRERAASRPCDCSKQEYQRPGDERVHLRSANTFTQSLEECHSVTNKLRENIRDLDQVNLNLVEERRILEKKMVAMIEENEELKVALSSAQHVGCGENKWALYLPTNKMFLFTNNVVTFAKAAEICASLGGMQAVVATDDEENYVFNISRRIAPKKRFWIGIKKFKDGSLRWADGSTVDPVNLKRFSTTQDSKLRNGGTYCVETIPNKHEWHLAPCGRTRRTLCTKDYDGEIG